MRVGGCKTLLRNESNRWDPQGAPSTDHASSGERFELEHKC
jgi:hypothetical protein